MRLAQVERGPRVQGRIARPTIARAVAGHVKERARLQVRAGRLTGRGQGFVEQGPNLTRRVGGDLGQQREDGRGEFGAERVGARAGQGLSLLVPCARVVPLARGKAGACQG